jgi:hypothetical protein
MGRFVFAAAMLVAISPVSQANETGDDGSFNWFLDAGAGRFEGDFGLPEDTTIDVLNLSARRQLPRGAVQLSVPYLRIDGPADIVVIGGQPVAVPGAGDSRTESGLGDLMLQGEYYLRTGTESSPWVIGLLRFKAPTGDETRGLGTGAADVEAGIGLIQRHGPVHWLADVGYTWVGSSSEFELRDVLRLGAGVAMSFGPNDRHNSYVYLENRTNMVKGSDDRRALALGVGTSLDEAQRVRVSASLFIGLSDTAEDLGFYVTLGRRI